MNGWRNFSVKGRLSYLARALIFNAQFFHFAPQGDNMHSQFLGRLIAMASMLGKDIANDLGLRTVQLPHPQRFFFISRRNSEQEIPRQMRSSNLGSTRENKGMLNNIF